jgi:hypothetical protein
MVETHGMADNVDQVSHLEIFRAVIALETKVDLLLQRETSRDESEQKRDERINALERSQAWILGICAALSILGPIIVTAAAPRLQFGQPATHEQHR